MKLPLDMLESSQLDSTLDHILRGHPDAFLSIVRAYGPGLRAWLSSQLFHQDEVDDLAQETFIAAYRSLHTFQRDQDFGAWLRGIARNKLLRHFEHIQRQASRMEQFRQEASAWLQDELDQHAAKTRREKLQLMLNCIRQLPERLRHVIRSHMEGNKAASLAEEMQTSTGAIYQLQYRALGLLRECMARKITHEH